MPILLLLLLVGTLGYLWYTRRTTRLTRDCRWRRGQDEWRCVACGATAEAGVEPRYCGRGP
jgi:hypothetical protein